MTTRDSFDTVGIMFDTNKPGDEEVATGEFPNLRTVDRSYGYTNLGSDFIPEDSPMWKWAVIAYDTRGMSYGDEDSRAMDVTNYAAILDELPISSSDVPNVYSSYGHLPATATESASQGWTLQGYEEALEVGIAIIKGIGGNPCLIVSPTADYNDMSHKPTPDPNDPTVCKVCAYTLDEHETPSLVLDRMAELLRSLSDYPLLDEDAYSSLEWEAWQDYAPTALGDEIRDASRDERYDSETVDKLEEVATDLLPILANHLNSQGGFSGEYSPDFLDIFDTLLAEDDMALLEVWNPLRASTLKANTQLSLDTQA